MSTDAEVSVEADGQLAVPDAGQAAAVDGTKTVGNRANDAGTVGEAVELGTVELDDLVDRVLIEEPVEDALTSDQVVQIVEQVRCGPARFSASLSEDSANILIDVDGCHGSCQWWVYPGACSSVDDVLQELWEGTIDLLESSFTYRGQPVKIQRD